MRGHPTERSGWTPTTFDGGERGSSWHRTAWVCNEEPGWTAKRINEPVSAADEAELMKYLRENMDNPPPVPYHSFLICYVDDVVFLSVDEDQLLAHWLTVIFWFKKKQLFVAMSKVHIGCESIRFLGFCTGYNLQFADVERCRAIALIPEPKTQKENKRFIGGAGFYAGTVPDFGRLCAPLHRCNRGDVDKKDVSSRWTITLDPTHPKRKTHWKLRDGSLIEKEPEFDISAQDGFDAIKARLCHGTLLRSPNWKLRFWVASDASLTGYGSTLAQMSEENRLMPLAFNSGHFTMTEQRRPSIVREADGIARATHEYRWCLLGTEFDFFLISDCMPVEHARKAKSINNGFISRLALSLYEYPGMKLY